ncbi:MAG: hypothetical protein ACRD22_03185 [Terriglobia bacterium]
MNKMLAFWIASSVVLFLLSLVYFHQNLHRKNSPFAWWLGVGVSMQMVSAYGMLLAFPAWMYRLWPMADGLSFALALGVLAVAFVRRSCPVNRALLYGVGAMIALNVMARCIGGGLGEGIESWLQNIAFLGPALFLLTAFSNIRADRLPLYVRAVLHSLRLNPTVDQAIAFTGPTDSPSAQAA